MRTSNHVLFRRPLLIFSYLNTLIQLAAGSESGGMTSSSLLHFVGAYTARAFLSVNMSGRCSYLHCRSME